PVDIAADLVAACSSPTVVARRQSFLSSPDIRPFAFSPTDIPFSSLPTSSLLADRSSPLVASRCRLANASKTPFGVKTLCFGDLREAIETANSEFHGRLFQKTHHRRSTRVTLLETPNIRFGLQSVWRRQSFLLRSLTGKSELSSPRMSSPALEADAIGILRAITPNLDPTKHKGQAGKIAVIGGCREYTGAPYFSAISALKLGADLSHVFCTRDAAPIIKSYSPELIVHPILEESYSVRDEEKRSVSEKVLNEFDKWMERFDCIVIGPGLGRDPFLLGCVSDIIKHARKLNIPLDGLFLVTDSLDLVSGYPLAVLTPNVNEYKRLVQKVLRCEVSGEDAPGELLSLIQRIGGITVLRKGKSDLISDGEAVCSVSVFGSPRRCGGQGDILSGSVAVFLSWAHHLISTSVDSGLSGLGPTNPTVLGCIAGSALLRKAASLAFLNKKRSTLTGDIIECLGESLETISPAAS
ncbi:hypothetical protein V2J09_013703, partial [Rumex salicifolius]